jgi:hypothetical protein
MTSREYIESLYSKLDALAEKSEKLAGQREAGEITARDYRYRQDQLREKAYVIEEELDDIDPERWR